MSMSVLQSAILYVLLITIYCDAIVNNPMSDTTITPHSTTSALPTVNSTTQHLSSADVTDTNGTWLTEEATSKAPEVVTTNMKDNLPPETSILSSSASQVINVSEKREQADSSTAVANQSTNKEDNGSDKDSKRLTSGLSVSSDINDNQHQSQQHNHPRKNNDGDKRIIDGKSEVYQSDSKDDKLIPQALPSTAETTIETKAQLTTQMTSSSREENEKVVVETPRPSNDRNNPLRCYTCNIPGYPKCDDPFLIENGKLAVCPTTDGKRYFCGKLRGVISGLPDALESLTLPLEVPKNVPISESIDKWTSNVTNRVTFRYGDEFIARLCFPKLHEYVWRREPYNLTHKHGDITVVGRVYLCRNTRCNNSLNTHNKSYLMIISALTLVACSFHGQSIN